MQKRELTDADAPLGLERRYRCEAAHRKETEEDL